MTFEEQIAIHVSKQIQALNQLPRISAGYRCHSCGSLVRLYRDREWCPKGCFLNVNLGKHGTP